MDLIDHSVQPVANELFTEDEDFMFNINSPEFCTDEFRMYHFKIRRCPKQRPHDWTQCPFAHVGERATRRDPRLFNYCGSACAEFRRTGSCSRGDHCSYAHGVFECWLHPSKYKTQMCSDVKCCKRPVCFFAHSMAELRVATANGMVKACPDQGPFPNAYSLDTTARLVSNLSPVKKLPSGPGDTMAHDLERLFGGYRGSSAPGCFGNPSNDGSLINATSPRHSAPGSQTAIATFLHSVVNLQHNVPGVNVMQLLQAVGGGNSIQATVANSGPFHAPSQGLPTMSAPQQNFLHPDNHGTMSFTCNGKEDELTAALMQCNMHSQMSNHPASMQVPHGQGFQGESEGLHAGPPDMTLPPEGMHHEGYPIGPCGHQFSSVPFGHGARFSSDSLPIINGALHNIHSGTAASPQSGSLHTFAAPFPSTIDGSVSSAQLAPSRNQGMMFLQPQSQDTAKWGSNASSWLQSQKEPERCGLTWSAPKHALPRAGCTAGDANENMPPSQDGGSILLPPGDGAVSMPLHGSVQNSKPPSALSMNDNSPPVTTDVQACATPARSDRAIACAVTSTHPSAAASCLSSACGAASALTVGTAGDASARGIWAEPPPGSVSADCDAWKSMSSSGLPGSRGSARSEHSSCAGGGAENMPLTSLDVDALAVSKTDSLLDALPRDLSDIKLGDVTNRPLH